MYRRDQPLEREDASVILCKVDRTPAALVDLEEIIFGLLLPSDKKGAAGKATSRRGKSECLPFGHQLMVPGIKQRGFG